MSENDLIVKDCTVNNVSGGDEDYLNAIVVAHKETMQTIKAAMGTRPTMVTGMYFDQGKRKR